MRVNTIVKKCLRGLGFEISRFIPSSSSTSQLSTSLQRFDIDMILDVGANKGQFAIEMREAGFKGQIISFEPLSQAYDELTRAKKHDQKWEIYPRCALGSHRHQAEINIAANLASSSILPMLDSHLSAAPHTAYVSQELVEVYALDEIMCGVTNKYKNIVLKIDTQGFEWQILDGAKSLMPEIRGVILELSLIPLYEGQHLWQETIKRLESEGFVLWALQPGFIDPSNGRTLQMDGIFFRIDEGQQ